MDKNDLIFCVDLIADCANFLSKQIFKIPCNCPVIINKRLKSTLANFITYKSDESVYFIEVSQKVLDRKDLCFLIDVLGHELCHWRLYTTGHKDQYRDGSELFESLIKMHGFHSSGDFDIDCYEPSSKVLSYEELFKEEFCL